MNLPTYVIFIMHTIVFCVTIFADIILFQLLNYQEGNLKVQSLTKSGYYIVPNPSTTLFHMYEKKHTSNGTQYADSNATHAID